MSRGHQCRPLENPRETIRHRCAGCGQERATYPGAMPSGWNPTTDGREWCNRSACKAVRDAVTARLGVAR